MSHQNSSLNIFTEDQKQKFITKIMTTHADYLKTLGLNPSGATMHAPKCEICGSLSWDVTDHIFCAPALGEQGKVLVNYASFPAVFLSCKNCGNTKTFSANLAGIEYER